MSNRKSNRQRFNRKNLGRYILVQSSALLFVICPCVLFYLLCWKLFIKNLLTYDLNGRASLALLIIVSSLILFPTYLILSHLVSRVLLKLGILPHLQACRTFPRGRSWHDYTRTKK